MDRQHGSLIYIPVFLLVAFASVAIYYVGFETFEAAHCKQDITQDGFISDCANKSIGDYEHGAFFYNLEPRAIENLKKAEVITLGNSYMQMAFGAEFADQFFARRGIRYFQLGFGFRQYMEFPLALLKRYHIRPKLLIINADPFFSTEERGPAKDILNGNIFWPYIKYAVKKFALKAGRSACEATGWDALKLSECEKDDVGNRSNVTGRWIRRYDLTRSVPLIPTTAQYPESELTNATRVAADFFEAIPMDRSCVVLTMVPNPDPDDDPRFAVALARVLGTQVVNASVENMTSVDTHHMTMETATRWEKALLPQLDPILERCLKRPMP